MSDIVPTDTTKLALAILIFGAFDAAGLMALQEKTNLTTIATLAAVGIGGAYMFQRS